MNKIAYYPDHKDVDRSACHIDPLEKPYIGKVIEVEITEENNHHASVKARNGYTFMISKWPLKFWGKARGLFDTRAKAEECLNLPLAVFDGDGNLMNKISKSDS
jgi:hypothetical protein